MSIFYQQSLHLEKSNILPLGNAVLNIIFVLVLQYDSVISTQLSRGRIAGLVVVCLGQEISSESRNESYFK